jgi:hypothetical protein
MLNELLGSLEGLRANLYADASEDGSATAAAGINTAGTRVRRVLNDASIFSGEAKAIRLALDVTEQSGRDKFVFHVCRVSRIAVSTIV